MAHMIDTSNARNNMAYVGETPWHGLGQSLQPGLSIDEWALAAGLAHSVESTPVKFTIGDEECFFPERRVLYRSDTHKPLSVVSKDYRVVQPSTVLGFFEKLCEHNRFTMETAGALDDGKRIWALAKAGEGAPIIGSDLVRPYVLLATSYDGTLATIAKLTTVRVVCHNTLSMAAREAEAEAKRGDSSVVRIPHSADFREDEVRINLGIALSSFDRFRIDMKALAGKRVNKAFCTEFLKQLLPAPTKTVITKGVKHVETRPIEESKAYQQIMGLFQGEAMGAGLPEANGTAWGLLNAVTQHVDWNRGRTDNSRITSAWFGEGAKLKEQARDILVEVCA